MATVHLVCGFIGAGKTTFSGALAKQHAAVKLSLDDLYLQLFTDEPTRHLDDKALGRLLKMLEGIWPQILEAGIDVVLDFGFWQRAFRDDSRATASAVGAEIRLYWLQCPDDIALAHCMKRNRSPGAFLITPQDFHDLKARFEPPAADEVSEIISCSDEKPLL